MQVSTRSCSPKQALRSALATASHTAGTVRGGLLQATTLLLCRRNSDGGAYLFAPAECLLGIPAAAKLSVESRLGSFQFRLRPSCTFQDETCHISKSVQKISFNKYGSKAWTHVWKALQGERAFLDRIGLKTGYFDSYLR